MPHDQMTPHESGADWFLQARALQFAWIVSLLVFVTTCIVPRELSAFQVEQTQSINQQVRSLLSNKCFACHGPDDAAREADLRLDTRDGALESAIDLDDPESSELMYRVQSDDEDTIMPPPKHGEPLSGTERELLLKWMRNGAKYERHWSYEQPRKVNVPQPDSDLSPIDCFVQQRLIGSGLAPSQLADRTTLIRRLAIDLTGLPPTLEQVDRFLADQSPNAYEKLVDHYLSQPTFGERWASVWLDLARYADSAGYAEDRKRTIWLYRDYVIRSFNENKPFDQFTIEQIAGDLLPNAGDAERIATAFHRNTLTNTEGGTSDEEFRSAAIVDRVNTTMAVWMGTTMACAQCHTHKYDPITQHEYFQFYDFFNQTADNDRADEAPVLNVYSDEQSRKRRAFEVEITALKAKLDEKPTEDSFRNWLKTLRDIKTNSVNGQFVRISIPGKNKILSLAEVQVFSVVDSRAINVAGEGTARQSTTGFNGPAKLAIDGNTDGDHSNGSVTHTATGDKNVWWEVDLKNVKPIQRISVWSRTDNNLHKRLDGYRIAILDKDREVVWEMTYKKAIAEEQVSQVAMLEPEILELISNNEKLDEKQQNDLRDYHAGLDRQEKQAELATVEEKRNSIQPTTSVPVMEAVKDSMKRETKVQIRGNYLQTGETVFAGTPKVFQPLPETAKPDRLALAKWLVDNKNPLTARVVVNRYWEQLFGTGLVETSEEFGAQGELPSHPQLLDWLAVDLMEHDWDTRRLLRQIVLSRTYQQSSHADEKSLELDPANRLLSRGPRLRLSAEMIRDQALFASGLLSLKMYGPPVQPPQPKVGLKPAFTGKTTDWTDSTGDDRYRRAIYTEWRRSAPYPSMSTFDVNNREVCEVRRMATNTPLQALVTLNDPVYVEAAQALARLVVADASAVSTAEKVQLAFRRCLIRKPNQKELDRIVALFNETRSHFENDEASAKLLAVDPLNPPADDTDLVALAAWTTVANVLLNLDETLMKP